MRATPLLLLLAAWWACGADAIVGNVWPLLPNRLPWLASVHWSADLEGAQQRRVSPSVFVSTSAATTPSRERTTYTCTGSLLSRRVVLTTATCAKIDIGVDPAGLETAGVVYFGGIARTVVATWLHPGADPAVAPTDNLALLLLDAPVDAAVIPTLPPASAPRLAVNSTVLMAGFGMRGPPPSSRSSRSWTVQQTDNGRLGPVTIAACDAARRAEPDPAARAKLYARRAGLLCAGNRTQTICDGDDGGPLFVSHRDVDGRLVNETLHAIAVESRPRRCTMSDLPFWSVDLAEYRGWILSGVRTLMTLEHPLARRIRCMDLMRDRLAAAVGACAAAGGGVLAEPALVNAACGRVMHTGQNLDRAVRRAMWRWARCRCRSAFVTTGSEMAVDVLEGYRDQYVCRHPSDAARLAAGIRSAIGAAWDALAKKRVCNGTDVNVVAIVNAQIGSRCRWGM